MARVILRKVANSTFSDALSEQKRRIKKKKKDNKIILIDSVLSKKLKEGVLLLYLIFLEK